MKITLELNENQAYLLIKALDLYSRIGIGQLEEICNHPTFQHVVKQRCTPDRVPVIGDSTYQGTILDIQNGKALISGSVKDGKWSEEHEWKPLEEVKLACDWTAIHGIINVAKAYLSTVKAILIGPEYGINGSYGIHNENVDESCRVAFDVQQVIRHEFWKLNPNRSEMTVDASVYKIGDQPLLKIKIEDNEYTV